MSEVPLIQKGYTSVLTHFIEHDRAPHYVELAEILDIPIDDSRVLIRDTVAAPIASCWLSHDTDYIESWAPFSNVPTHLKITPGNHSTGYFSPSIRMSWSKLVVNAGQVFINNESESEKIAKSS